VLKNEHLIDIHDESGRLGSALRLTRKFALTAAHCLRGQVPTEQTDSRLRLPDGTPVVVPMYNTTSDLALLRLVLGDDDALLPRVSFDTARRGEPWTATYRFPAGDKPPTGSVEDPDALYRRTDSLVVRAMRLRCELRKDHAPFAGSPVERGVSERTGQGAVSPVALGVVVEPWDRAWSESDEIFAGSVAEALDLFSITGMRLVVDGSSGSFGPVAGEREAERHTNGESMVGRILRGEDMDYFVQVEWTP
jgi:hypothetical protein